MRVKGQRVRVLRQYLSEHTKTDAADAYVLGAIPLFGGVPVDPVYVPNADRHALQTPAVTIPIAALSPTSW